MAPTDLYKAIEDNAANIKLIVANTVVPSELLYYF